MEEFSISAMKRVIKSQGDKRVSEEAAKQLGSKIENFAEEVAEESLESARIEGRKTVKSEDIRSSLS